MQPSSTFNPNDAWFEQLPVSEGLVSALSQHKPTNPDELASFVYDLPALANHLNSLQEQEVIKLWYAVKANPLSRVIQTVDSAGINFDVASLGELNQVKKQGVSPERILNTGPAKSKKQLAEFVEAGVNIFVVESLNQLTWLNEVAADKNVNPNVLLRVQLQWQEGEKNPLGGNALTPFGLSVEEWQGVNLEDYPHLNVNGLHIFQWGNLLSNAKMYSLWQQMVPPLVGLADSLGMNLEILDLGGGLGVDYLETGQGLSWSQIIEDLADIKRQAGVKELWLELGRYAVAHTGYYLTQVVDRKTNYQQEQLVLAAGINHLLRPAITDQPFPARLLRESKQECLSFDVHGPLCTSMDKLGRLSFPADTNIDDTLVFAFAGAYGFTESMPFFLCHQIAAEYVYTENGLEEVRTAQPADWYLR